MAAYKNSRCGKIKFNKTGKVIIKYKTNISDKEFKFYSKFG